MTKNNLIRGIVIASALLGATGTALASSHREAPAIAQDQYADNTDTYVFISPEDPDNIVFVANYVPILLGSTGPNFYRFADSVLYEIKIDNDGDAEADISYQFTFNTTVARGGTFLYNDGAITTTTPSAAAGGLNVGQTYQVRRVNLDDGTGVDLLDSPAAVAPWYVGKRSFGSGGTGDTPDERYENLALSAVENPEGGGKVFAGPRNEPFYVDLHVFDLLGVAGAPTTNGVNVMSIVLEVPITEVASGGVRPTASSGAGSRIIGTYATASRRQVSILRRSRAADHHGQWVQVSRLGWPLVNEALIGLQDKDKFNRSEPADDVANFGAYILQPGLPGLLNAVLGLTCTENADIPGGMGRTYLVPLLQGAASGSTPSELAAGDVAPADLLRVNITTGETFASQRDNVVPGQAFPNGRQLADDVTDIELTALCTADLSVAVGDGVDFADSDDEFTDTFPYLASPFSGNP